MFFQNLFASLMLASSCGTPKLPVQRANSGYNVIHGGYCFKHVDDNGIFFEHNSLGFENDVTISFTYQDPRGSIYAVNPNPYNEYYGTFEELDNIVITYYADTDTIFVHIDYYELMVDFDIWYGDTWVEILENYEHSENLKMIGINTSDFIYLNNEQMTLFNTLFTNTPNSYFLYYTGWYSMNTNFASATGSYMVNIVTTYTYDNTLLNRFQMYLTSNSNRPTVVVYGQDMVKAIVDNGTYTVQDNRVYFNSVFLTYNDLAHLSDNGSFTFIPRTENYTLTDLFIDIADTPVMFISNMFSFELLGTSFYVGFISVMTVIVMVWILKKVI